MTTMPWWGLSAQYITYSNSVLLSQLVGGQVNYKSKATSHSLRRTECIIYYIFSAQKHISQSSFNYIYEIGIGRQVNNSLGYNISVLDFWFRHLTKWSSFKAYFIIYRWLFIEIAHFDMYVLAMQIELNWAQWGCLSFNFQHDYHE